MGSFINRRGRGLVGIAVASTLVLAVTACGGPAPSGPSAAPSLSAEGTDDGASLTLWTRAPLEKQAKALVAAYNDSHKNKVELTVVPNDDYVAKV
ncbi:MAG: hypothetical protein AAGC63_12985, partial [Propionicimonas sp.]